VTRLWVGQRLIRFQTRARDIPLLQNRIDQFWG